MTRSFKTSASAWRQLSVLAGPHASRRVAALVDLKTIRRVPNYSMHRGTMRMMSSMGNDPQNPMNPNLYTEKAFDAIAKLPQYADKFQTQMVEAPLLLRALLDDKAGLGYRILSKAGVNGDNVVSNLDAYLSKQPKVSDTTNKSMGRSMMDCLNKATNLKREFGDSFVSVEHLLLGAADTDGYSKRVFSEVGTTLSKLKEAVLAIRGDNKVTTRTPEVSYEALSKYARDLTEAARQGKLDPVIGRDDEIRRTIQILSRRTKNTLFYLASPAWARRPLLRDWRRELSLGMCQKRSRVAP